MREGTHPVGEEAVTARPIYEFDGIRVDLGRMAASRGDAPILMEPKAFDVLVFLIEHRDRVVTRDELLDAVWTGTFVTPNVLTRAVAHVRKALGDEAENTRFIETVAKRGYRFIAPVSVSEPRLARGGVPRLAPAPAPPPLQAVARRPSANRGRLRIAAVATIAAAVAIAAAIVFYRAAAPARNPQAADLHLRRLTNRRGFTGFPALSPDGRAVVYTSDVTGSLELYLASLVQGGAELPLTKDGGHNMQPAWSPDGQWIAFHSRKRGGVWIVPATGGVPQQISDFGSDPAWSPGSDQIVFTSDAGGLVGQSSLWVVRRDGTGRRALTAIGTPPGGHRAPAWSHDGRHVAFVVGRGTWRIEVRTVDVATGEQQLVDVATSASDPVFTTDDRALLWGGTNLTGNGRLFRHAIDQAGKPIGDAETLLPMDGAGLIDGLSVAANGTVSFAAGTLDANLWSLTLDAAGRPSEPVRLTDDVARSTHAEFSGDGRIAYMQIAVGSMPSVWIMRADGSQRMALLPGTGAGHPEWDRRLERLLLVVFREGMEDPVQLAWADIASRRLSPVPLTLKEMLNARLSPDASRLAYHRIEKDGAIGVWTSTWDGVRTRVATDREAVSYPAWSPDGQLLALELKRGDSTRVGIVSSTGGPVEELTTDRGQSWPHSWAPDSDRIAFAGERYGVWNVYTVSRRTRAVSKLTSFSSAAAYVRYPSWSPSGSQIIFERGMMSANIWTLTLPQDH